jgi:F-type H+-transporting ATPase subunit a
MATTFHIPGLPPDVLTTIGGIQITNTMVNVWIAIIVLLAAGIWVKTAVKIRPGRIQLVLEMIIDTLRGYFDQVTGDREKTNRFFPLVASLFFFILLSNWLGLLPGTGSITFHGHPLLRPANTDLNLTVAMALTSVIISHVFAFVSVGVFTHLGKFIQIKGIIKSIPKGPIAIFTALIEFFVGILEIIGEIAKIFSLSLRLFGNIFAGEVLITVISSLVGVLVPAPFMLLEILVGLIQASVFAMLTLVYLTVASSAPHGADHDEHEGEGEHEAAHHAEKQPVHP